MKGRVLTLFKQKTIDSNFPSHKIRALLAILNKLE